MEICNKTMNIFLANCTWNIHSLIFKTLLSTGLLSLQLTQALACPASEEWMMNRDQSRKTHIVETNDGRQYRCWLDISSNAGIDFQGNFFNLALRCSRNLIIYMNFDGDGVIDRNGSRRAYESNFLGTHHECDTAGETEFKSWTYRLGNSTLRYTQQEYTPYYPSPD